MAPLLGFTIEPDEVALLVTQRWFNGYFYELGELKTVCVIFGLQMFFFAASFVLGLVTTPPDSSGTFMGFLLGGFVGSLVFTFGLLGLLVSRRFVVSNRRIVDCGGLWRPRAWTLRFGEVESVKPFYRNESESTYSPDFQLKAVYLGERSGEMHMIPVDAYLELVRQKLLPETLRILFPASVKR
jgi:hypothetical protein